MNKQSKKKAAKDKVVTDQRLMGRIKNFLQDSSNDYIAARTLFLTGLPQQAAILASTAIEKAFKAVLAAYGRETIGHLQRAHWNQVKDLAPALFSTLNQDFLKLNQKVYQLRYSEAVSEGYNVVIASFEYLWELDKTIFAIHRRMLIPDANGNPTVRQLDALIEANDERLMKHNRFTKVTHDEPFNYEVEHQVFELRKHEGLIHEATYQTTNKPERPDDPGFLREGFKIDGLEVTFAFPMKYPIY